METSQTLSKCTLHSCAEIKEVRKRKERAKELEGLDMSNIVSSARRRSTASFIPPPKPKVPVESDEDDVEDTDDDDDDVGDDEDNDSDGEDDNDVDDSQGGESSAVIIAQVKTSAVVCSASAILQFTVFISMF
ncbi:unnamed protein product [Ilex paraguariensis]|uniref:Histone chaperone domain-containing protein n=1 Tax=Ilex paraguariensis TaxID=185542 RepID=A0ABC8TNU0_9AQUA